MRNGGTVFRMDNRKVPSDSSGLSTEASSAPWLPSLRFRLLGGLLTLLFVALFTVAITVYIAFRLALPLGVSAGILTLVIIGDLLLLGVFASYRLRELVLAPADAMVEGAERIAAGDSEHRLPAADTIELQRLSSAVNSMADGLLWNQEELAANVRSLDATNRELSEARTRLVRAEKLASIGRLSAGVAHEVGNPLGAIMGYLEVGKRQGADSEWVDGIGYETRRIDRIVRGLLDYARPKEAADREVDLNETVRRTDEMLRLQGRFRRTTVSLALAPDLPLVRGDANQLEQVLVNLLLNATDAVDEGPDDGHIEILTRSVQVEPESAALVQRRQNDPSGIDYSHLRRLDQARDPGPARRLKPGNQAVELLVRDDGPGIPDSDRGRVFEPFFTTKEPGRGTGLGLAVSARMIEGMGGTIEALPGEGGGAVLRLLLPTASGETA
jgi:two-component system NtrC family sensor kinase